jgi:hypothetical protein
MEKRPRRLTKLCTPRRTTLRFQLFAPWYGSFCVGILFGRRCGRCLMHHIGNIIASGSIAVIEQRFLDHATASLERISVVGLVVPRYWYKRVLLFVVIDTLRLTFSRKISSPRFPAYFTLCRLSSKRHLQRLSTDSGLQAVECMHREASAGTHTAATESVGTDCVIH